MFAHLTMAAYTSHRIKLKLCVKSVLKRFVTQTHIQFVHLMTLKLKRTMLIKDSYKNINLKQQAKMLNLYIFITGFLWFVSIITNFLYKSYLLIYKTIKTMWWQRLHSRNFQTCNIHMCLLLRLLADTYHLGRWCILDRRDFDKGLCNMIMPTHGIKPWSYVQLPYLLVLWCFGYKQSSWSQKLTANVCFIIFVSMQNSSCPGKY